MLFKEYDAKLDSLRTAVTTARGIDLSALPTKHQKALTEAFVNGLATFDRVSDIRNTHKKLESYKPTYAPIHKTARNTERKIRNLYARIKFYDNELRKVSRDRSNDQQAIADIKTNIGKLKNEIASYKEILPKNWDARRKHYLYLANAEKRARNIYRRTGDDAYEPIAKMVLMLRQTEALVVLGPQLKKLRNSIKISKMHEIYD